MICGESNERQGEAKMFCKLDDGTVNSLGNWIKAITLVGGGIGGLIAGLHFYPREVLVVILVLGSLAALALYTWVVKEMLDD
jgi:hypothetical protein